jgi:hypothetical protein
MPNTKTKNLNFDDSLAELSREEQIAQLEAEYLRQIDRASVAGQYSEVQRLAVELKRILQEFANSKKDLN